MRATRLAVLGAGSYGTALALTLARNGYPVALWGHDAAALLQMQQQRCNAKYLPDIPFPDELVLVPELAQLVAAHQDILVVVPSDGFAALLRQIQPYLRSDARIVWATKGLEFGTGRLLHEVAQDILGKSYPLAVMSGPTFAKELAAGLPTAIAVASANPNFLHDLQQLFHCDKSFRVYRNSDMIGVQVGGAAKNVIAIGVGISDGMGFGANARTALITRGLAEITRLGVAMGAHPETFIGMAGLGDLVLTCTDNQSRNRRFGLLLGQGRSVPEAITQIEQVVEGYHTTQAVVKLAEHFAVDMPITHQIYQILYCGKAAQQAATDLLSRISTNESLLS